MRKCRYFVKSHIMLTMLRYFNFFSFCHKTGSYFQNIDMIFQGSIYDHMWHFTTKGSISRKSRSRVKGLQRSNVKVDLKIFFLKNWNLRSHIYHLTKYCCWTEVASLCFECIKYSLPMNCKRSLYFQAHFLMIILDWEILFLQLWKIIKNTNWK